MATHRCLWCGELYLPKTGAVRSYYCCKSHKEKAYRFRAKCKKTRIAFYLTNGSLHSLNNLVMSCGSPNRAQRVIGDIMQYVDERGQREVIRLLRELHQQAREGETLQW